MNEENGAVEELKRQGKPTHNGEEISDEVYIDFLEKATQHMALVLYLRTTKLKSSFWYDAVFVTVLVWGMVSYVPQSTFWSTFALATLAGTAASAIRRALRKDPQ